MFPMTDVLVFMCAVLFLGLVSGGVLQLSCVWRKLDELPEARAVLDVIAGGVTFEKCVALAVDRFYFVYRDAIQSLVRC